MTAPGVASPGASDGFADALIAARLCAIDPGLGGMILRGGSERRDAVVAELRAGLRADAPLRRMPTHIDDGRLLGGVDLFATLASGRAVSRPGLLAEADGGIVVMPMAERLTDALAGQVAAAIDRGEVIAEREGGTVRTPTRFVVVALDDGVDADERPPAALAERLAFAIDLADAGAAGAPAGGGIVPLAQAIETIAAVAAALGVDSARASLFALRAARAAARVAGRDGIGEADVALAARLVLAPRATRMPVPAEQSEPEPPPPSDDAGNEEERGEPGQLEDIVLAAALASLPKDVLARIAAGRSRKTTRATGGGEKRKSATRGRPMTARAGMPGGGVRLSMIDTLRAAIPMQRIRGGGDGRVRLRRADLRVRRFEARAQALTIFAVDASGSSALARLAEAKGAVELLLAEAYVKRTEVALVAFRGTAAELLLPPTRSLARARRSLAELPGGGGTPLAAGLNAARELAESAKARGRTPFVVVLTDGRANIAADGSAVRALAEADADAAAKAIGAAGIAAAFVDTSARPRAEGAALAAAMRARYLPLPRADATAMHAAIGAAQRG